MHLQILYTDIIARAWTPITRTVASPNNFDKSRKSANRLIYEIVFHRVRNFSTNGMHVRGGNNPRSAFPDARNAARRSLGAFLFGASTV